MADADAAALAIAAVLAAATVDVILAVGGGYGREEGKNHQQRVKEGLKEGK